MTLSYHLDTNYPLLYSTVLYCTVLYSHQQHIRGWDAIVERPVSRQDHCGRCEQGIVRGGRSSWALPPHHCDIVVCCVICDSLYVCGGSWVLFCSVLSCRSLLFSFPTLGSNGLNSAPFTFTSSSYLIYCPSNTVYFYSPNPTRPSLTLPLTQGIDRLERLKGIPLKLIAIEQFLEEQPQWRGKLIFNMIGELGDWQTLFILSHLLHCCAVASSFTWLTNRVDPSPTHPFPFLLFSSLPLSQHCLLLLLDRETCLHLPLNNISLITA